MRKIFRLSFLWVSLILFVGGIFNHLSYAATVKATPEEEHIVKNLKEGTPAQTKTHVYVKSGNTIEKMRISKPGVSREGISCRWRGAAGWQGNCW